VKKFIDYATPTTYGSSMPKRDRREYYKRTREARLKYQRDYIARQKRWDEVLEVTDPEELRTRKEEKRKRYNAYMKEYLKDYRRGITRKKGRK